MAREGDSCVTYATAEITFIDRHSGTKRGYCYPVTQVVLRERDHPERGRVFEANDAGQWVEVVESTHTKEVTA